MWNGPRGGSAPAAPAALRGPYLREQGLEETLDAGFLKNSAKSLSISKYDDVGASAKNLKYHRD